MSDEKYKVLLLENSKTTANIVKKTLLSKERGCSPVQQAEFDFQYFATIGSLFKGINQNTQEILIFSEDYLEKSGKKFIDKLKKKAPNLPLIMLTNESNENLENSLSHYLDDILTLDDLIAPTLKRSIYYILNKKNIEIELLQKKQEIVKAQSDVKDIKQKLETVTLKDPLTGLANRDLFYDRLDSAIKLAKRRGKKVVTILIDMRNFKEINREAGHVTGDKIIQLFADRLTTIARESDTIARLGGNEFGFIMHSGACIEGAKKIAGRIVSEMNKPFTIDNTSFHLSVHMGISEYPTHASDSHTIVECAMNAMRHAKEVQSTLYIHKSKDEPKQPVTRVTSSDLKKAFLNDELELFYQPKIRLHDNVFSGMEGLVRWNHPKLGLLTPDKFLPLAENSGSIHELTSFVLRKAFKQSSYWHEQEHLFNISVNLSTHNLHNPDFPKEVKRILKETSASPHLICCEITESAIMVDPEQAIKVVQELSDIGFTISIDDFGMGYSSLSYLKEMPVSEVKIDKSFVFYMTKKKEDDVIVRTIIDLGHKLGIYVVAEGVEDKETMEALKEYHCNYAQGYFISKPMEAGAVMDWYKKSPWNIRPFTDNKVILGQKKILTPII